MNYQINPDLLQKLKEDVDAITQVGTDIKSLTSLEKKLHIQLPPSYKAFLLECNGGQFGYARIFAIDHTGTDTIFDLETMLKTLRKKIKGTEQKQVLPFANDWEGGYFCFDLKDNTLEEYPVLYWNHEFAEDPEDEVHLWTKFADNFNHFLEKIIED